MHPVFLLAADFSKSKIRVAMSLIGSDSENNVSGLDWVESSTARVGSRILDPCLSLCRLIFIYLFRYLFRLLSCHRQQTCDAVH